MPIGDGGQQRITEDLFDSMGPGGELPGASTVERLVLHPLCSVRQRQPESELLNRLDMLNRAFGAEVTRLTADDRELRAEVAQLVLDMSDLAVSAIEAEASAEPAGFGVTADFLERVERIAGDLRGRTSEARLQTELDDLVGLAQQLLGVPPSELIAVLGGSRPTSD